MWYAVGRIIKGRSGTRNKAHLPVAVVIYQFIISILYLGNSDELHHVVV